MFAKFLQTCYVNGGTDLVLAPGVAPLMRRDGGWHRLEIPPLGPDDIKKIAADLLYAQPFARNRTYAFVDFAYADLARFRATAFDYPDTSVVVITRIDAPPGTVGRQGVSG
ncbi:MAG TPA: hypothetical protein VH475_11100 [Tepidisphaeraceae bacterium]|jgi:Tfp pilus assembly pilus retraction ATPase PilT